VCKQRQFTKYIGFATSAGHSKLLWICQLTSGNKQRCFTLVLAFMNTWLSISLLDLLWATPAFLIASSLKEQEKTRLGISWGHQKILSVVRKDCKTAFYPSLIYRLNHMHTHYLKLPLFKMSSNNGEKSQLSFKRQHKYFLQKFKNNC